jgi:hypothetical protein
MVIEENIEIAAPLSLVWQVFSTLTDWGSWNSVCQDCCLETGQKMAAGTCFSFKLTPYYLPIKITPRITKCEAARKVVWEGKRLGIHAVHRFDFQEVGDKVMVTSTELFGGPLFFLARLLFIPQQLHRLSKKLLADIKQAAEARDAREDANRQGYGPLKSGTFEGKLL